MDEIVTSVEANRRIAELLRGAREGRRFTVTSHGRPVARIVPVADDPVVGARQALLERLRTQPPTHGRHWSRDELYERDP